MTTKLIAVTQSVDDITPEQLIVYCARVSNPNNQDNHDTGHKLLRYCIRNGHWSVFEQASMTVEVETSRAIAAQILRHRSFTFQEFSQRYSNVSKLGDDLIVLPEMRAKHVEGNRQGSGINIGSNMAEDCAFEIDDMAYNSLLMAMKTYKLLVDNGVAPECARMVLPLCTRTRLYMNGTVRSWIHYFNQRCSEHTQKEHRMIALEIRDTHFKQTFPMIHELITTEQGQHIV